MVRRKFSFLAVGGYNLANNVVAAGFVLLQLSAFILAQNSTAEWQTLDGSAPLVIARGGYSGMFPDSSASAYILAVRTGVPDLVLWCDVQLTKDGAGICFPNIMLNNGSTVERVYPNMASSYIVDGAKIDGYFSIDFTLEELQLVFLTQVNNARSAAFDGRDIIAKVEDVFMQNQPAGFWLNIEHDAFYSQHNLSMRSYVINAADTVFISHISSPEIAFLRQLASAFATTETKLIFRFLEQDAIEVTTNQTYGSLLKNLTFIQSFASGILVPKSYIWPVDETSYLLPHTSLVADAHKNGLEIFASGFANDNNIPYNYSFNPVAEYLSFIDNKEFSVDGVLTDFPTTSSEARDCFAYVDSNASVEAKPLVISQFGASGDYPGCTDISYTAAISDGADVIDCPVQMSKDGVPFCLSSANLMDSTLVTQTAFRNLLTTATEIQPNQGVFSFSLSWTDIQSLKPVISSPYEERFLLFRNPKFRNAGKLISLADFLDLAKNASSLSGVLIKIENAKYLAANQGMSITDAVLSALENAGYNGSTAKKVMIQSTSSAVLKAMKGKEYKLVYEVDETIHDAPNATIVEIKRFANSVVVNKESVFPLDKGYVSSLTDVVQHIQSFQLPVYVQIFRNEFVAIAFDFFSDPIAEINNFVVGAGVDGLITEFPKTTVEYKKNRCLKMEASPPYMSLVRPAELISLIDPVLLPPAEAPSPLLNADDISESPLPAVVKDDSSSPTSTPEAPKSSPSGQHQITASTLLSLLSIFIAVCLML